jgi:manganese transport protein
MVPRLEALDSPPVATRGTVGFRRFLAFSGPAYLVSVGYMDPGNWATDLEAGARFGYRLLWVLVLSNLMAIVLQTLSARLGLATGRDLAQTCRHRYPRPINFALWFLCEIAIAACDLAEVLGVAIGLNLLFKIPLLGGVAIAALDTLLILGLSRYGIRVLERVVLVLVVVIGTCFGLQIFLAKPVLSEVIGGLVPALSSESLFVAIAMLGATVMPHNLYLHSALVQTREIGEGDASKRIAARYNLYDSVLALNVALLVNCGILVLASAVFFKHGVVVTEIQQAHSLLAPLLGTTLASILFAVALIASGQSSTMTGTMAGQIVMEGFLNLRMRPWLRRLITRSIAIIPAAITIYLAGEAATYKLLLLSQVILSIQLPFAVVPLIHFTNDGERMGVLRSPRWLQLLAWVAAAVIICLNIWLAAQALHGTTAVILTLPLGALLGYILLEPWIAKRPVSDASVLPEAPVEGPLSIPAYRTILVPLDHSELDRPALRHAAALARQYGSKLLILHVEEGVASQIYGPDARTAEELEGSRYLNRILERMAENGVEAEAVVAYSGKPRKEIIRVARERSPDLIVMGAHGHKGLKDIIFGSTINAVRHNVRAPVLAVQRDPE